MRRNLVLTLILTAFLGLALSAANSGSAPLKSDEKLPAAVESTFRAAFPRAVIERLDAEEENGVMVYDFEFKDGTFEKETDIALDGTMLESTLVVVPDAVPEAAMKTIRATAKGGKLGRLERIQKSYDVKDGKVVALPATVTHFACEMTRAGKKAEVFVDSRGAVVEAPEWVSVKQPKPKPGGKAAK